MLTQLEFTHASRLAFAGYLRSATTDQFDARLCAVLDLRFVAQLSHLWRSDCHGPSNALPVQRLFRLRYLLIWRFLVMLWLMWLVVMWMLVET